jgi:hypothetical protein
MMISKSIFLETTIQADRILGTKKRKETVIKNLKDKSLLSSRTVLGEFINTFIHDAAVYYNLIVDSPNAEEALKRLPHIRQRVTNRRIAIFASVAEESGWDRLDILDKLEQWIEWGLIKRFNQGIALLSGTNCRKTEATPIKDGDQYIIPIPGLSCTKTPTRACNIEAFIDINKKEFSKIIERLENLVTKDNDQNNAIGEGKKVLAEEEKPFGQTCQTLKDVIIAIEAPENSCIYTSNITHFRPICEALQKDLYIEEI